MKIVYRNEKKPAPNAIRETFLLVIARDLIPHTVLQNPTKQNKAPKEYTRGSSGNPFRKIGLNRVDIFHLKTADL